MEASLIETDVRWGREWAADPANSDRVRQLAVAVKACQIEFRHTRGDLEGVARTMLDLMGGDAKGAGTGLAITLEIDDENKSKVDGIDREDAYAYWEENFPGDDADSPGGNYTDFVLYGDDEDTYGNGPLVGFVVGVMQHYETLPGATL